MSEVIVRMEMPKIPQNCGECKFHKPLYHTQYCVLEGKNCAPWKTRKDWCPIVGVLPEQHGRLIDASTVLFAAEDSDGVVPPMPVTIEDYLESFDLPTIVPATERSKT